MKRIMLMITSCMLMLFSLALIAAEIDGTHENTMQQKSEDILFADLDDNDKIDKNDPVVVMKAEDYQEIFNTKAPLERMLRSQVDDVEYIVLKNEDLKMLDTNKDLTITAADQHGLHKIYLIDADSTINGSLIITTAELIDLGKLKGIILNTNDIKEREQQKEHEIHFKGGDETNIKTTKEKVPWMGL